MSCNPRRLLLEPWGLHDLAPTGAAANAAEVAQGSCSKPCGFSEDFKIKYRRAKTEPYATLLEGYRKQGPGYQTRINTLLRAYMQERQKRRA